MKPSVLMLSSIYDFSVDLVALRLKEIGVPYCLHLLSWQYEESENQPSEIGSLRHYRRVGFICFAELLRYIEMLTNAQVATKL